MSISGSIFKYKQGSPIAHNRKCNADKLLILMTSIFFVISLYMTTQTYLNWDVSWLLEVTRRLLSGGCYSQNFIETNPPLILFLYAIPILLTSWIGNLVSNFLIFIYAISLLSLSLSYLLLKKIMTNDVLGRTLFFLGLVFGELVLPSYEFGQREHLTLMFIMPYLLLISLNTLQFPWYLRFTAGLMAGIGFSIKPHFLIPLILILSWKLYKNRDFKQCFIIENVCILGVMLLYLVACFIVTPDYFTYILPLVFKFYLGYKESMFSILTHQWSVVFYIIMLLGIIQLKHKNFPYRDLYELLMLTNFGFFLVFVIGGHFFYYHFVVVAALSILLLMCNIQLFAQRITKKNIIPMIEYLNISLVAFCLFFLLQVVVDYDLWIIKRDASGPTRPLIMAFQNINKGPFVVFSNYVAPNASLMTYSQLHSSARLAQFWLLPRIAKLEQDGNLSLAEEGKNLLRQIIIQDLLSDPPNIIVVDETDPQMVIDGEVLNYLHFLLQDSRFKKIWHNYHLTSRVHSAFGNYAIYTLRS